MPKKLFIVVLVLACAGIAFSRHVSAAVSVAEWQAKVQATRNIVYAQPDGHPLTLNIYIPRGVPQPLPLVIWIHGGGWTQGDKRDPMIIELGATEAGIAVASIDYRFSQMASYPAQIYDCKAAVRWLRAHAPEYGLDPNRIAVAGTSAGGHLAALIGTTARHPELEGDEGNAGVSSAVCATVDFFGPVDFTNLGPVYSASTDNPVAKLLGGSIAQKPDLARAASPVLFVDRFSTPFFIAHGTADTIVPLSQSIELDAALKKAGVPSTLFIVPGERHGNFQNPQPFERAVDFLRHYLSVPAR